MTRRRPCVVCGTTTTRQWCSRECHQADEPDHIGRCPDCGGTSHHDPYCPNQPGGIYS